MSLGVFKTQRLQKTDGGTPCLPFFGAAAAVAGTVVVAVGLEASAGVTVVGAVVNRGPVVSLLMTVKKVAYVLAFLIRDFDNVKGQRGSPTMMWSNVDMKGMNHHGVESLA